ncbi:hypothetical protein BDF22DRAFT_690764 [Syncephalis plumigaleata]|nr:hypothetical protein BDF22DRAFT_690764 [Syncephalis plumigaleata]
MFHYQPQRQLIILQWILLFIIGLSIAISAKEQAEGEGRVFNSFLTPKLAANKTPTKLPGEQLLLLTESGIDVNSGKIYPNLTVMDVLNDIKNISFFRELVHSVPVFEKAFRTQTQRHIVFAPSNDNFILVDGWKDHANTTDGQAQLRYTLGYHVIQFGLDLGAFPALQPWPLPTVAYSKEKRVKSILFYIHKKDAQINCATIISQMINVGNGAVVVLDRPLDPWLEAPAVNAFVNNGTGISCKSLDSKAKLDFTPSS